MPPGLPETDLVLSDALERFLLQLRANGRSPHTIGQYRRHIARLAAWFASTGRDARVARVVPQDLAAFLASPQARLRPDGLPKHERSVNALRSSIRGFFGFLHEAGTLDLNPARLVRRARTGEPLPRVLSGNEQARLLAALAGAATPAERRDRMLFELMLGTGIRLGSAIGLDVDDVDLEAAELRLRRAKGGSNQIAVVPRALVLPLRLYLAGLGPGPLLRGPSGRRMSSRHVRRRFATWLGRARIEGAGGPHVLRHTFATGIYRRTGDLLLTRDGLGHRSIASTLIYARSDQGRLRAALERSTKGGRRSGVRGLEDG